LNRDLSLAPRLDLRPGLDLELNPNLNPSLDPRLDPRLI
jgi:hypothetical protein